MKHLRRWGAVWILLALFLGSWAGQFVTQLAVERNEAQEHGQAFQMAEFWPQFLASTLENWQSEWAQLILQAVLLLALGSKLFRADQTASQDDIARLEAKLDRALHHD